MADILVVYMRIESKPNFNRFLGCLSKGQSSDDRNGACTQDIDELPESPGIMAQCGIFEESDSTAFQRIQ